MSPRQHVSLTAGKPINVFQREAGGWGRGGKRCGGDISHWKESSVFLTGGHVR